MHLVLLDRWNSLDSPLHRLDPRAKIVGLLGLVVFLATRRGGTRGLAAVAVLLLVLILVSGVPLVYYLKRAALVLPFTAMAAIASLLAPAHAPTPVSILAAKSYLAALVVLLLIATTRMADLLRGLESLHVPGLLLMVVQFLYRYLFVLSEEAQHMSYARQSRAGRRRLWSLNAAGGAIAVLFARSYARAERIHQAMLARGFQGHMPTLRRIRWRAADTVFVVLVAGFVAALLIP